MKYKIIEYRNIINKLLDEIVEDEMENIELAAKKLVNTIKKEKTIWVFGASHAGIVSEELFYRAGGIAIINPIFDRRVMLDRRPITDTTVSETTQEIGKNIFDDSNIKEGDTIILHSVSGRNPITIEMAIEAKKKKVCVIAITNVCYSKTVNSRHEDNKNLYEYADVVIDNHGEKGDASISFDGLAQKASPTSTVTGIFIGNSIVIRTIELLIEKGIEPPILYSANVDGGIEKNKELFKKWKNNIFYM